MASGNEMLRLFMCGTNESDNGGPSGLLKKKAKVEAKVEAKGVQFQQPQQENPKEADSVKTSYEDETGAQPQHTPESRDLDAVSVLFQIIQEIEKSDVQTLSLPVSLMRFLLDATEKNVAYKPNDNTEENRILRLLHMVKHLPQFLQLRSFISSKYTPDCLKHMLAEVGEIMFPATQFMSEKEEFASMFDRTNQTILQLAGLMDSSFMMRDGREAQVKEAVQCIESLMEDATPTMRPAFQRIRDGLEKNGQATFSSDHLDYTVFCNVRREDGEPIRIPAPRQPRAVTGDPGSAEYKAAVAFNNALAKEELGKWSNDLGVKSKDIERGINDVLYLFNHGKKGEYSKKEVLKAMAHFTRILLAAQKHRLGRSERRMGPVIKDSIKNAASANSLSQKEFLDEEMFKDAGKTPEEWQEVCESVHREVLEGRVNNTRSNSSKRTAYVEGVMKEMVNEKDSPIVRRLKLFSMMRFTICTLFKLCGEHIFIACLAVVYQAYSKKAEAAIAKESKPALPRQYVETAGTQAGCVEDYEPPTSGFCDAAGTQAFPLDDGEESGSPVIPLNNDEEWDSQLGAPSSPAGSVTY